MAIGKGILMKLAASGYVPTPGTRQQQEYNITVAFTTSDGNTDACVVNFVLDDGYSEP